MKRYFIISLILLSAFACKKEKFSPEGPTDVRIRNKSTSVFNEVTVSNSDSTKLLGTVNPGNVSDYIRFSKAYYTAKITAKINVGGSMVTYSTGEVDYTYLNYVGLARITYEVDISNNKLEITHVIPEEDLILK
jgi:hypothetical protein